MISPNHPSAVTRFERGFARENEGFCVIRDKPSKKVRKQTRRPLTKSPWIFNIICFPHSSKSD